MLPIRDSLQGKRQRLKMEREKNTVHVNGNDKKVGVAILI